MLKNILNHNGSSTGKADLRGMPPHAIPSKRKSVSRRDRLRDVALISALSFIMAVPAYATGSNVSGIAPVPGIPASTETRTPNLSFVGQGGCVQQYDQAFIDINTASLIAETASVTAAGIGAAADVTGLIAQEVAGIVDSAAWITLAAALAADIPLVGTATPAAIPAGVLGGSSIAKNIALGAQIIGAGSTVAGVAADGVALGFAYDAHALDIYVNDLHECDQQFTGTVTVEGGGVNVTGDSYFHDDVGIDGDLDVSQTVTANQVHAAQGISAHGGGIWLGDLNGTSYSSGITLGGGALSGAGDGGLQAFTGDLTAVAIGNDANASAAGGVALGEAANADAVDAVAVGHDATASGVGGIAMGGNATTGTGISIGYNAGIAGDAGVAVGVGARAFEDTDSAFGNGATVNAANGTALGANTLITSNSENGLAVGQGTTIGGANAVGSDNVTAIGQNIDILDGVDNAVALGTESNVAADGGIAIGQLADAQAVDSIAMGRDVDTAGTRAVGIGYGADADGFESVALGENADAWSTGSIAIGSDADANAVVAIAMGDNAAVTGTGGIAMGGNAVTNAGVSIGNNAGIAGDNGVAVGSSSRAFEDNDTAIGNASVVNATNGTAVGADTIISGLSNNGVVVGQGSTIGGANVLGSQNVTIVGQNVNILDGISNVVAVGTNSNVAAVGGIAIGDTAETRKRDAIAIGRNVTTYGIRAVGIGYNAEANARESVSIGNAAEANGKWGVALGHDATVGFRGISSVAIGDGSRVGGPSSVALGAFSSTGRSEHSTAIGAGSIATLDYQQMFGTSADTYAMPGLTSVLSRERQLTRLQLPTTDEYGNLASDGGAVFKAIARAQAGIALGYALSPPQLTQNENFGVRVGYGYNDGEGTGVGFNAIGVLHRGFLMDNDRLAFTIGIGTGNSEFFDYRVNTIAGGAGLQFTW